MNLYIDFLWHFHQPFYYDLKDKIFHLPWVRLHAIRNYYPLGKYMERHPTVKMNFNFTPSLIESIEKYNQGIYDYLFTLSLKNINSLIEKERLYIIKNSFYGYYPTTIKPYRRYRELYIKKIENELSDKALLEKFNDQDLIDLIVLSNLSWSSTYARKKDDFIKYLIKKEVSYTEHEKRSLLEKELMILKEVLPLYKNLQKRGQIEITTTPYAHPIAPLIADNYSAKISLPDHPLPDKRFSYPLDLDIHIKKAISAYYRAFDSFPSGMWPAEGAVGKFVLPWFWENGIKWIATDSEILGMTKGIFLTYDENGVTNNPEILYKPYILKRGIPKLYILFRDHALSDLFGFVYSGMNPEDAINDFIKKLKKIREKLKNKNGNYLITIILDGENPWEYYEKARQDKFFDLLLSTLEDLSFIKTVKISEFLKKNGEFEFLPNLFTGSWINHNLRTWIGDEEKNMAWEYLFKVREDFKSIKNKKEDAYSSLLFAEGSDWFWWYGEGHETPEEDKLDFLFRKHLKNVYMLSGYRYPSFLDKPIINIRRKDIPFKEFTPNINGVLDSPSEWTYAGMYRVESGAMSEANISYPFSAIFYGNDRVNFYLRLDLKKDCCDNIVVTLNGIDYHYDLRDVKGDTVFAYKDILEIAIPISKEEESVRLKVSFKKGENIVSFPIDYYIIIPLKQEGSVNEEKMH